MKTMITFRHIQPTPAIKKYVTDRLERLDKFGTTPMEAHVILAMERFLHNAEVVLTAKGLKKTGTASTSDMYASIEEAIGKVEKALRRYHDKKVKAKTHPGRVDAAA